jgi:hypothetical protein
MLNAYLMKAANKKIKFYNLTEPYFKNSNYAEALGRFMGKNGGVSYPFRLFWIDFFYNLIKRNSSHDDSSILRITAPEGSSYE